MSNDNDPSNPSSRLSSKARLAYYLTGGTRRGPGTMTSLLRLARDRNDAGRGHKAWGAARDEDLARHQDRWGQSVWGPSRGGSPWSAGIGRTDGVEETEGRRWRWCRRTGLFSQRRRGSNRPSSHPRTTFMARVMRSSRDGEMWMETGVVATMEQEANPHQQLSDDGGDGRSKDRIQSLQLNMERMTGSPSAIRFSAHQVVSAYSQVLTLLLGRLVRSRGQPVSRVMTGH
jgi:hypothetical protein